MKYLAIALLYCITPAFGTTYYVSSSSGSDSNTGTSMSSPWQTITKVNAGFYSPGDSILFKSGDTWVGSPNFPTTLITPDAGSSGSPITYGSYGTGAAPILDGGNSLTTLITISQNYITVTGLQLQNATKTWITFTGTTGTTITYVTAKNAATWGFYGISGVGNTLIDHTTCTSDSNWTMIAWCFVAQGNGPFTFTNNTCDLRNLNPSTSSSACVQLNGSSNAVIEYNYAYGGSQAFAIKAGSINPATITGGLIADNYAYQIFKLGGGDGESIELTGSAANPQSGVTVTRNVIVCQSGSGGTSNAIGHYYSTNDIVSSNVIVGACGTENSVHISSSSSGYYYNNTFSGGTGTYGIHVLPGSSVTAENNIFDDFSIGIFCDGCASVTEDYDLYNSNVPTPVYKAALGSHSATVTDPQFVNSPPAAANDVKLQPSSPAIGAGASLGSSFSSILNPSGTAVPFGTFDQSSAWMMGAFGYHARSITKTAGDNQSNAVDSVFPTPLQVLIKDSNGNPVSGATVEYSPVAGGSGANGTFSGSATVTTDSNGLATAPDLTSNANAGQFTVTATAGALTATFSLTNVTTPQISVNPSTLPFGNQNVNSTSSPQTITVSNASSGAVSITSISITGANTADFSQSNTCGTSIDAGSSCTISITFTPQASGPRSASLIVSDDAPDSPQTASLSGTGVTSQVTLNPSGLSFDNQNVNTTSTAQIISLSNPGSGALSISSITVTGTNAADFNQTNTCGTSVAAGSSCTISITFTPEAAGARSASLSVTDDASGSPQAATLSGTGVAAQVSLNPTAVSFGSQNVNTTSAAQTITLSNTGSAVLSITSIAVTGTNAGDFAQTNTCGTSVAAGSSCTISVAFTPQATGPRSASLSLTDNASDSPQTPALSGTGVGVAQASLNPSSVSFGSQNVKTTSAPQTITLSNAGSAALSITGIAITGANTADFAQTNTCGTSLAAGSSCTFSVTFTPQAAGARSASLVVTDNATGSPQSAALSGNGVGVSQASLNPTSLSFGNQNVNTSSTAKVITLSNGGTGTLSISSIGITGTNATDFTQSNTCGSSVTAGASCSISVTFTPQAVGARSASLAVTDNATGSPQTAALSGTGVGVAQASLNPTSLSFGNQNVRTTSAAKVITLSNGGTAALSITSIAVIGTNATDFAQTNTCGSSVAAGASCSISVTFTPQATGSRSASVVITDNAAGSPQSATVSGTGVGVPQVSVSPSSLSFGNQKLKTASSARNITLSNTGTATLSITSVTMTGSNPADFSQTNTCKTSVAAGASCTISVKFTPQAAGARSASLTVADNASGSPQKATLTGTGVPITLTPSTLSFGAQKVKTTSSARTITVANIGSTSVSITSISITGTNTSDFSQTHTCRTSLAAGASCTVSVKFTPQATGTRSASLSITDNAAGSPHKATLSGTGD